MSINFLFFIGLPLLVSSAAMRSIENMGSSYWRNKDSKKKLYSEGRHNVYAEGEQVELWVNSLNSPKVPYTMEYSRFPFCQPEDGGRMEDTYFGDFLAGDRIAASPYMIEMKKDEYCKLLCIANLGKAEERGTSPNKMVRGIRNDYHHNWILDGLASAGITEDDSTITTSYWEGFPMGYVAEDDGRSYINNHVNIEILYRKHENTEMYEILRFTTEGFSVKHEFDVSLQRDGDLEELDIDLTHIYDDDWEDTIVNWVNITNPLSSCMPWNDSDTKSLLPHTRFKDVTNSGTNRLPQLASGQVLFTYDIIWKNDVTVDWTHRWDIYMPYDQIDDGYVGIITMASLGAIGCSLVVAFIIAVKVNRLFKRQRYQAVAASYDEANRGADRGGIQALRGEVFRCPETAPRLFVFCCGSGMHLLSTILVSLIILSNASLEPRHLRGSVLLVGTIAFGVSSFANGVVTACVSSSFFGNPGTLDWGTLLAPMWLPISAFGMLEIVNAYDLFVRNDSAIPFFKLQFSLMLWFVLALPCACLGSYVGYGWSNTLKLDAFHHQSPRRQIPTQPKYMRLPFVMCAAGILPFVCLWPILGSWTLWVKFFGWSSVEFVASIALSSLISILCILIQLQKENHHWWWRAFCIGGSPALYIFGACIFLGDYTGFFVSIMSYLFVSVCAFLLMGASSVGACICFNKLLFQTLSPACDGTDYLMLRDEPPLFNGHQPE